MQPLWVMLTWVIFRLEISFYDFQHQISRLHLIGKFQNSVWGTTLQPQKHFFGDHTLVGGFMKSFHGNDHGCLLNKKVGLWCPYQHIQRAPKSYAAPLSYADLSDFYTRDFLLWFSTSNISAPFNWKIPKIGMGNHTNPINKVFLWSMAEIPTMSENKARESGIFGFPWFQPCLFSQKWWVVRTWTIK